MYLIRQLALSGASLLAAAVAAPALAVQLSNQPPSNVANVKTTGAVERGGTIDVVDMQKKTITVDGVKYALPSMPVAIHASTGATIGTVAELTAGTKIRFNTSKYNYAAQDQVNEVWVIGAISKPIAKKPIRNTPGRNKPGNP